ncbi:MAG: Response regulator consisting of a CheY-like receiver domain and a winged-helix DNA-binding domain [Evtepia sp.]|jgi:two-component system alkaline phosphatase synthesis response regulator PhoP|nr:Response regulator consisting of a CheY-like receiver domain and a winged-helix DNA-binding domain [Evtepia sp.]
MIYLLEDEPSIRKLVVYTLNNSGLQTEGFATAGEFWQSMRMHVPQLVLLDIMLPDEDGLDVLKKLRSSPATAKLPVIMLTAKGTEYDKVLGLDLGADDYLPKPFGMMELVARVKSLLRRSEPEQKQPDEYRLGGLFVSIPRHLVTVFDSPVTLTPKEFDVLVFLLRNPGIVLTRDQIMSGVWGYDFDGESRTVDVHIRTLRAKFGECADLVETVRGVGYRIGGGV